MGRFYGIKIKNGEINSRTENAWSLDDVPKLWKVQVASWLSENEGN